MRKRDPKIFRSNQLLEGGKVKRLMTGELAFARKGWVLSAEALGSCVAVIIYDEKNRIGAMAHCMLPGRREPGAEGSRYRYSRDAVREIMRRILRAGAKQKDLRAFLVGGGNVLRKRNDKFCAMNVKGAKEALASHGLKPLRCSVGGFERRRAAADLERGIISYSVGGGAVRTLWRSKKTVARGKNGEPGKTQGRAGQSQA